MERARAYFDQLNNGAECKKMFRRSSTTSE